MTGDRSKQSVALAGLVNSIGSCLIAFGLTDATLTAGLQLVGNGIASVVLYYLHRRDAASGGNAA